MNETQMALAIVNLSPLVPASTLRRRGKKAVYADIYAAALLLTEDIAVLSVL